MSLMELHPDRNATASSAAPALSLSNDAPSEAPALSLSNETPSETVVIICCVMIVVAMILGTLANAFVIGCILRKKALRTSVNVLMANIAAAGLLATLTCTPTLIILLIDQPGNFRRLKVAKAQYAFAVFFDAVNLVSLASVGFERLQAVVRPYDKDLRFRRAYLAIGVSWATSLGLCLVAILTYSNWTNMEEEEWRWISMFYSYFYANIFIPLSCLTASVILGLYAAILVLLKKQSKKLELKSAVAPFGDSTLDGKQHENPTRLFMLSENMQTEPSTDFPSKTEQLDSNVGISNQPSSNPAANLSSNSNRRTNDYPTINVQASELRITSASTAQLREVDTANQLTISQTKSISNVRQSKSARHGSIDSKGPILVADRGDNKNKLSVATPYPLALQVFEGTSGSKPKPRLTFRNSIAVSRPSHVVSMCNMKDGGVSVLRKASSVCGDIFAISNALRERGKRSVEGRAAKLSAIAVAAFLLCWLPFPVIVSYQKHSGNRGAYQTGLFMFGLSLSLLGSAVNQLVYCLVNRQLRQEFIQLCKKIVSKLRTKN